MASVAMLIGGALANALAFIGSSYLFHRLSADNIGAERNSGDLRQGSSNNSGTNFVLGFPYIFQRETQPSFEDLLLVVSVIPR